MNNSGKNLGIGIIGSGFMGSTYAECVSTFIQGAQLAGIACGSRPAVELAEKYAVRHFPTYEELLQQDDVHVIIIATPHSHHAESGLAAAKAGKHLLIDKPMACTVEDCDAILKVCKEKNLKISITYTQRARMGNVKAKELIDSGKLGKVSHIRSYQLCAEGMDFVPKWQHTPENIGILLGHGVHNLDALRWFTGQEIQTVYAKCRSLEPKYPDSESSSDVLATLSDGTVGYVFVSFSLRKPGFSRSDMASRIVCEKGLIDIDAFGKTYASIEGGPMEILYEQEAIDFQGKGYLDPVRLQSYVTIIQDLVDSIRENRPTRFDGWSGRQAVAAALAAYESSQTGREIELSS